MKREQIEQLVAHAIPNRLPVSADERREQRHWVLRLTADLPDTWSATDASDLLSEKAASAVHEARAARGLPLDEDGSRVPVVRLLRIDGRHVIVSIETIRLEDDDTHAYLVAASVALRAIHETTPIDDIQGLPHRFWRVLVGG